jgi:hypothetical protein
VKTGGRQKTIPRGGREALLVATPGRIRLRCTRTPTQVSFLKLRVRGSAKGESYISLFIKVVNYEALSAYFRRQLWKKIK